MVPECKPEWNREAVTIFSRLPLTLQPTIEEPDDSDSDSSSTGAMAALEMLLDLLTSSQTQGVVGAAVASMSMMSSMGPMPMTMASGAPPGKGHFFSENMKYR